MKPDNQKFEVAQVVFNYNNQGTVIEHLPDGFFTVLWAKSKKTNTYDSATTTIYAEEDRRLTSKARARGAEPQRSGEGAQEPHKTCQVCGKPLAKPRIKEPWCYSCRKG